MPFDPIDMIVGGPDFKGKSGKQYVPLGGVVDLDATVQNTEDGAVRCETEHPARRRGPGRVPGDRDRAAVEPQRPREQAQQRGLPRAVLSYEPHDLAGHEVQRHAGDRLERAEPPRHVPRLEEAQRRIHRASARPAALTPPAAHATAWAHAPGSPYASFAYRHTPGNTCSTAPAIQATTPSPNTASMAGGPKWLITKT